MPLVGRKAIGTVAYLGGIQAVAEAFCWSWGELLAYSAHSLCESNEYIHRDKSTMSWHAAARNGLADRMLGDWLFMLDTDHAFEPDLLGRLLHRLNEHKLDVVTGVYVFKRPPHSPVIFGWNGEGHYPLAGWDKRAALIEIGAAGAGNLLIRKSVFERIAELGERPFDPFGAGGEDFGFFHRLRKLGIKAWCDVRVECPHLKPAGRVTLADHKYDPGDVFKVKGKQTILR